MILHKVNHVDFCADFKSVR